MTNAEKLEAYFTTQKGVGVNRYPIVVTFEVNGVCAETEKAKFETYIEAERKKGLLYHSFVNPSSSEEVYSELNRLIKSPDLTDPEVLGEYSPKVLNSAPQPATIQLN